MALGDYLAGEVVEDFADGLLTRREALRRLGLLGLGLTAAGPLLAACASGDSNGDAGEAGDDAAPEAPTTSSSAPNGEAGGEAEVISFDGESGELTAAYAAPPDAAKAAVLVVHENRGLTPHFHDLVSRFAAEEYAALCVDLLSPEGGTAGLTDEAAAPSALGAAPLERLLGDLRAGIDELERRHGGTKVGAVGFCFGGGMVWNLLHAGEARLAAAVPFYGPAPEPADFSNAKAAVLGVYAERDTRVNASRDRARAALEAAGLTHEIQTYAGADHAFFNDTGARHHPEAAAEAWTKVLAWFEQHLV